MLVDTNFFRLASKRIVFTTEIVALLSLWTKGCIIHNVPTLPTAQVLFDADDVPEAGFPLPGTAIVGADETAAAGGK